MTTRSRARLAVLAVVLGLAGWSVRAQAPTVIKGGKLDLIKLQVAKFPGTGDTAVVIRPFSTEGTDFGTGAKDAKSDAAKTDADTIAKDGPGLLAHAFESKLKELAYFGHVSVPESQAQAPATAIVVTGKFLKLDPGNRATRYLVGFGAGKSAVQVEGVVKDGSGRVLAEFTQQRIGAMGLAGGDSMGQLKSDAKSIGEDIAKFLDAWARGKPLK